MLLPVGAPRLIPAGAGQHLDRVLTEGEGNLLHRKKGDVASPGLQGAEVPSAELQLFRQRFLRQTPRRPPSAQIQPELALQAGFETQALVTGHTFQNQPDQPR